MNYRNSVIANQLIMIGVAHNDFWVVLWVISFSHLRCLIPVWLQYWYQQFFMIMWLLLLYMLIWDQLFMIKPNQHEWNHITLISDQQNFGFADFYNHVHKIKALWTHLNESRLGRSEFSGKPLTDELIRSQLKEKCSSSECDSSVLLLMSPAPVPQKSDLLNSLQPEMSSEPCTNIKSIDTRQTLVHWSLHS